MVKEEKMARREVVFTYQRLDYTVLTPPVADFLDDIIENSDPEGYTFI